MCNRAAERRRTKKKNDDYGEHGMITCVVITVSKQKLPLLLSTSFKREAHQRLHRGIGFYDERNSWATAIASNSSFSSPFSVHSLES
eukprot:scaffold3724_cov123-Skeletonema_dohrnii-CCMP3373.AAC.8